MRFVLAISIPAFVSLGGGVSAGPLASTPAGGVYDPELTALFTPPSAPPGAYAVWRSPEPIDAVAARLAALDPQPLADAWKVLRSEPGAVFTAGPYDRGKLARLYVGRRLSVARGTLETGSGLLAFTLVSPWPDARLGALQDGTLVIVIHLHTLLHELPPATPDVQRP